MDYVCRHPGRRTPHRPSSPAAAPTGGRGADATTLSQWEIVRFLNAVVPWPYPADGALMYYRDVALPAVQCGDECHWTLRLKQSPEHHIGVISLHKNAADNRGFWLGLPWHRQGLMTEAVIAVNDFWFDVLGFKTLRAPKAVGNLASSRISEKTGMRMVGIEERNFVSGRLPCEIWEITAEEWREARVHLRANQQR